MLASEALLKAKELLSNEKNWCRSGHYANDDTGFPVAVNSERACKFCVIGSVYNILQANPANFEIDNGIVDRYVRPAVSMNSFFDNYTPLKDMDGNPDGWRSVIIFNDFQASHSQLMEMFDKAIELAKADGN